MKTFYLFFLISFFLFFVYTRAQTDPNNDKNWNWLEGMTWTLYPKYNYPVGTPINPNNPFFQNGIGAAVYDNKPEDGWVLVQRDFGTSTRQVAPTAFLILYNKYQGLLRLFVYLELQEGYTIGSIRLSGDDAYAKTVALTFLSNISWGRNDLTKVKDRDGAATTPVLNGSWAFADFPITYDPTIATKTNSRLQFQIWGIQNYSITIDALGSMNQVFGNNQPANISDVGFFQSGVLFEAATKSVSGTQETWTKWQSVINNIGNGIDSNSTSPSLRNLRTWIKNLKNTWTIGNLGLIGAGVGLVDFLITGGRLTNKEQPSPINYLLNFKLNGSMQTNDHVGAVTLPLPGANHTNQYATNLLYNQPLGTFNLQQTPILQHKIYWWPRGGGLSTQTHSYRVKEDLLFDLNPSSDLEISSTEVAFVFELTGGGWPESFLQYADQGYSPIDNSQIELESNNNGKLVFRTPYINANAFKYQSITLPTGFKLYIKIKAELKVKNAPTNRQPVIFVATYDANVEEAAGSGYWTKPFYVAVTRKFEFDPNEFLPTQYGFGSQTIQLSTPSTLGNYQFAGWSDGVSSLNRQFTQTANLQALYKYVNKSNNSQTFSNNSQRKIVRTQNGDLHKVYSSMGRIFYERSTDNGTNWTIVTGKPLSIYESQSPAIDYYQNYVCIVFQELHNDKFDIRLSTFQNGDALISSLLVKGNSPYSNSFDASPVVAWGTDNKLLVLWRDETQGTVRLLHRYGTGFGAFYSASSGSLIDTDVNSLNPSLCSKKDGSNIKFHLAYQQTESSIKYRTLTVSNNEIVSSAITDVSNQSPYTKNYKPSLIVLVVNGAETIRFTWIGERSIYSEEENIN
ncbi:MAG: hypothetical protein Q8M94_20735, partial [Ignavibacteria bacterium]|nr:hypothetical protein [Ignavibacteria bacterium]